MMGLSIRVAALAAVMMVCELAGAGLSDDVKAAVKAADLRKGTIGISVRDADSGRLLVSINGEEPLTPASNMKLLSTGTALHVLGADFQFRTRLVQAGNSLVVIGDGDPALADPELLELMTWTDDAGVTRKGMDVDAFINLWVKAVKAAGITQVNEVIVDDRIFDRAFVHPGWPEDQLNLHYCAEVAGFNFHLNLLHFFPRPGKQRPDLSTFRPFASWLQPKNLATSSTGAKDKNTAWVSRPREANELTFHGNVKFTYREPVAVTLHDMPAVFASLLADRLKATGVAVGGARVATSADPQFDGTTIGPIIQTALSTVVARCNTDSQNLYAEALVKRSGAAMTRQSGSWSNGAGIVRHVVHQRVNDPALASKLKVADGSGLARENRVAADLMTAWLNSFHQDSGLSALFVDSLAVGGENGTIKSRFQNLSKTGAVVQCKTGYISKVSCLSGFVTMQDGRRQSFSVLCNDLTEANAVAKAKKLQEAVVQAMAENMARTAPAIGGP